MFKHSNFLILLIKLGLCSNPPAFKSLIKLGLCSNPPFFISISFNPRSPSIQVATTWEDVKSLRQDMERAGSASTVPFRIKLLQAAANMQVSWLCVCAGMEGDGGREGGRGEGVSGEWRWEGCVNHPI